jgi:hypothetical protein
MEPPMENHSPDEGNQSSKEEKHIFDNPKNVKRLIRILFSICFVLFIMDFIIHRHLSFEEGEFSVEAWPGFYAVYGFVACVVLVLVAKQMRKLLMRREDYYEH